MATPSSSLLYDLVPPKSDDRKSYAATDLIYSLLHNAGADVSSFRRNCQISYRLIEYARNLYYSINTLIETAEESGSWDHYDAYNRAIDPLEELLLGIMDVTEQERNEYIITSEMELGAFKGFMENWAKRRSQIREFMSNLREHSELKDLMIPSVEDKNELRLAEDHDDRTLLQSLLNSIKENATNVSRNKTQVIVEKVRESLQSGLDLQQGSPKKLLNSELSILTIKCAMIADGVIRLMKGVKVEQDSERYNRLYSDEIWDTAQLLATDIHRFLQDEEPKSNLEGLQQTYEKLEAALIGSVFINLPEGCTKLFPLVGYIGRSYHAQSQLLASLCYKAITKFKSAQNLDTHDALEKAIVKTIEAFKAAGALNNKIIEDGPTPSANGVVPNGVEFSVTGEYNGSCEELYDASAAEIKTCYSAMKIDDEPTLNERLAQARTKDQDRLEAYKKRTAQMSHNQEPIDIVLKLHEDQKDGKPIEEMKARVSRTARLTYIKWIVAKKLPDQDLENAHFESAESELSLDTEIGKLMVENNQCTLYLVVRKKD